MDAETAAMLVACGYAQLAARIEGQATDAVVGLNRAFDYYVEVGDLDSALAAAEFPRSTTSGTTPGAAELVERALQLVPPNSLPECRLLLRHGWEATIGAPRKPSTEPRGSLWRMVTSSWRCNPSRPLLRWMSSTWLAGRPW